MEDRIIDNRNNKQIAKAKGKFDPSRQKVNKHKNKKVYDDLFDDVEMLRIQGLVRCKDCESPYPRFLDECPMCK